MSWGPLRGQCLRQPALDAKKICKRAQRGGGGKASSVTPVGSTQVRMIPSFLRLRVKVQLIPQGPCSSVYDPSDKSAEEKLAFADMCEIEFPCQARPIVSRAIGLDAPAPFARRVIV